MKDTDTNRMLITFWLNSLLVVVRNLNIFKADVEIGYSRMCLIFIKYSIVQIELKK